MRLTKRKQMLARRFEAKTKSGLVLPRIVIFQRLSLNQGSMNAAVTTLVRKLFLTTG